MFENILRTFEAEIVEMLLRTFSLDPKQDVLIRKCVREGSVAIKSALI